MTTYIDNYILSKIGYEQRNKNTNYCHCYRYNDCSMVHGIIENSMEVVYE